MPASSHVSNQWREWGKGECERVTAQGMEIIPWLLLGIWCINTELEKH